MGTKSSVCYHVLREGEGWLIQREGLSREAALWARADAMPIDTREKAVSRAKELAQRHEFACVLVHADDGSVENCYAYGVNPERMDQER